jgi:hypothetical protein
MGTCQTAEKYNLPGWWFGTFGYVWIIFPHIVNVIIPTD